MPVRIINLLFATRIIMLLLLAGVADYRQLIAENFDVFLTFNDGNRRASFSVQIFDDNILEDIEDFDLELRFDPFAPIPSGVILDPAVATVFILDDGIVT